MGTSKHEGFRHFLCYILLLCWTQLDSLCGDRGSPVRIHQVRYDTVPLLYLCLPLSNYCVVRADRVIQKRRRDYADPNSSANMKKVNDDLQSIHNIMRKTIDDVLDRGQKLDGRNRSTANYLFCHRLLSL
jgi:hypothetical protein